MEHSRSKTGIVISLTLLCTIVPTALIAVLLKALIPHIPTQMLIAFLTISAIVPLITVPPVVVTFLAAFEKIRESVDRMNDLIRFDQLTGALTRSHFLDQVRGHRSDGALLIIDIDHFKRINDEHGHDIGDKALAMMAKMLITRVEGDGLVGRLGGEEFAVFLPGADLQAALQCGEMLCAHAIAASCASNEPWLHPTISIGATMRDENEPIGHTLKRADKALYMAKDLGRARLQFDPGPSRMKLIDDVIKARA